MKTTVLFSSIQCLTVMSIVSMSETGPAIMLKSIFKPLISDSKKKLIFKISKKSK